VRGPKLRIGFLAAVCVLALGAAGAGIGSTDQRGGGLIVFAGAADPTYLDPALVSDGESFRITEQIFEGLVELKPGTTQLRPGLATRWELAKDQKTWTFTLRRGAKFHDGTRFNAAAVCKNFNRWYNFSGPFQDASATYYWQSIFTGFKKNESANLGKSLYIGCTARGQYTAIIRLRKPNSPFLPSLVLSAFAIQSPTAMRKYGANQAELRDGVFRPTGTYAFSHPTGTGPFVFSQWTVGERIVLLRNKSYWGPKPLLDRIIIRPISNNAARLQALQTNEVQGYDLVAPQDIPTIRGNSNLKALDRPPFNVAYVTINQAKPPMDKLLVRQAVAHGLNRDIVVRSFYAGRAVVAHQFMPSTVPGYEPKVKKYPFNPERAKALLRQAGLTLPVKIEFWWPTNISRPYMPDPKLNFEAFKASLEQSGFEVESRSAPWRPTYVPNVNQGTAGHLNIIGWTGDYGHPDNFVGTFFQDYNPQFGFRNAKLTTLLNRAEAATDIKKRDALYRQINRFIANFVPGVPYAHTRPALGFQRRVGGYVPSPVGTDPFLSVYVGGQ